MNVRVRQLVFSHQHSAERSLDRRRTHSRRAQRIRRSAHALELAACLRCLGPLTTRPHGSVSPCVRTRRNRIRGAQTEARKEARGLPIRDSPAPPNTLRQWGALLGVHLRALRHQERRAKGSKRVARLGRRSLRRRGLAQLFPFQLGTRAEYEADSVLKPLAYPNLTLRRCPS